MRGSRYVEELHCSQDSARLWLTPPEFLLHHWERTHRSENPVVPSKYALRTHLHVGSAPLPGYVWDARVLPPPPPPPAAVGSGVAVLGWSSPWRGTRTGGWWVLRSTVWLTGPRLLLLLLASPQYQGCFLVRFSFSNVNKQSHPEFERKGPMSLPPEDNWQWSSSSDCL